jgi:selenocysteine lyase/cysteine desulfurase
MMAGLKFLKELGPENVYARIHDLARRTYAMAKERPYLNLYSSEDHTLYGSLVTIGFQGRDLKPLWERLKQKRIWTTQGERLRLSPHVHTRPQDLELFFSTLDEVLGRRA